MEKSLAEQNKERIDLMWEDFYGNKRTGEMGAVQKIDEMYQIMTQFKGWKTLGGLIILLGAVIVTLKVWFK